jgi:anti-anti-sigma regulatory factor
MSNLMRTIYLPATLGLTEANTLAETFRTSRGDDLVIDASFVQSVSERCAEVLRMALEDWASDGRRLTLLEGVLDLTARARAAVTAQAAFKRRSA